MTNLALHTCLTCLGSRSSTWIISWSSRMYTRGHRVQQTTDDRPPRPVRRMPGDSPLLYRELIRDKAAMARAKAVMGAAISPQRRPKTLTGVRKRWERADKAQRATRCHTERKVRRWRLLTAAYSLFSITLAIGLDYSLAPPPPPHPVSFHSPPVISFIQHSTLGSSDFDKIFENCFASCGFGLAKDI
jgi:hypothetical protein